jgi:protein gp37
MSATSSIEWTDRTWNPVRGCSIVSPGCVNCYAMKQAHRFSGAGKAYHGLTKQTKAGPQWTGVVRTVDAALLEPLSWRKPARVFVNSMSDLFHEDVPDAFIDQVFAVMGRAYWHTFQVLTKRASRMHAYMQDRHGDVLDAFARVIVRAANSPRTVAWPLPNVWLGVSVENQKFADERIPLLLQTPAAVRFISAEPLLGPVNLREMAGRDDWHVDALDTPDPSCRLHWVIVGGESGPGARPFDLAWARSIVQQCQAAGVPVFVKQLGARPYVCDVNDSDDGPWPIRHKKGGNPDEWPVDLRVREWLEVRQ